MKRCMEAWGSNWEESKETDQRGVKGNGSKRNVHLCLKKVRFLICEREKYKEVDIGPKDDCALSGRETVLGESLV